MKTKTQRRRTGGALATKTTAKPEPKTTVKSPKQARTPAAKPAQSLNESAHRNGKAATNGKANGKLNGKANGQVSSRTGVLPARRDYEAFTLDQDLPIIYVNGEMLPKRAAKVSVYDHGLLYGDGVFEGIRVYRGKIFKLQQHMDRLWRCAERIRLTIPVTREEMIGIQRRCIEANKLSDGYIRLLITRGAGALGLNPFKCPRAGVVCIADQIHLYPPELYKTGMNVIIAKRPRIPVECLDPRIKSLNYLNNILAKVEAIDAGCLEAIMLTLDGYVSECTGDNIFVVKKGQVLTPPSHEGLLEGVTRQFVMGDLCPRLGFPCMERRMRVEDVFSADELFLTGTACEIMPVTSVDGRVIGSGTEGPITQRLRAMFREIVTGTNVPEN